MAPSFRARSHRVLAGVSVCFWLGAACVQWQPIAPPTARLPRWVRVTTRDSTQFLLEDATFEGDTLVGRVMDAGRSATPVTVRVPAAAIAHAEARVPSVGGSAGVAAAVLAGVVAITWAAAHAGSP